MACLTLFYITNTRNHVGFCASSYLINVRTTMVSALVVQDGASTCW